MDNPSANMEKLAAELSGNTLMDENMMNDQTHQQIIAFLKSEKVNTFRFVLDLECVSCNLLIL